MIRMILLICILSISGKVHAGASETTHVLAQEIVRLNLNPHTAYNHLERFAFRTAWIESDYKIDAESTSSSAKGLYQFTDASLITGLKRLNLYYKKKPSWIKIAEKYKDISRLNADQQTALFFANLFQRRGTDPYLVLIASGNTWAMKHAYAKFHHTNVDEATVKRMELYFE